MSKQATTTYNLQIANPSLVKEWHLVKNGKLKPTDFLPGSHKEVWWFCKTGDPEHEWKASIKSRSQLKSGCPYCNGKKVCKSNSLTTRFPEIASLWHPTKNGNLTPDKITGKSGRKVWWFCSECKQSWVAKVATKTSKKKTGCPYCIGQKVYEGNSLATLFPDIAKEWHPTKNKITPKEITAGSNKRAWWLCRYNHRHEWIASVVDRTTGHGCRFCSPKSSALELRILAEIRYLFNRVKHRERVFGNECDIYIPGIKSGIEVDGYYWHQKKLKAEKLKSSIFKKNNILLLRIRDNRLPRVSKDDIFFTKHSSQLGIIKSIVKKLLNRFEIKNKQKYRLQTYLLSNSFKNNEEFLSLLEQLPKPSSGQSLMDKYPEIAKDFHPTKNGLLLPENISYGSNQKIWWLCHHCQYEWTDWVVRRTVNGRGCPSCRRLVPSDKYSLVTEFPILVKDWHHRNKKLPNEYLPHSNERVWWLCHICGYEWLTSINNRAYGSRCPNCMGNRKNKYC